VRPLGDLLIQLGRSLSQGAGDRRAGATVDVTGVEVSIPIESSIGRHGELRASLPRGRMATGFQLRHGHLSARFGAAE
jgi:hypothetical protein